MRIVAILGAALTVATLSLEAASGGGAWAAKEGGTFRIGIAAENFDSVDAAISGSPGDIPILSATCAGVMRRPDKPFPEGLRVVPELTGDYPKITEGGKKYTFVIRKGLRFSTGAPLTAADVAHTINRVLDPTLKAYAAGYFLDVVGARDVQDGKTPIASGIRARGNIVTIRLVRPLGDFTARLANACIVPRTVGSDPEGAKPPIPSAAPYYVAEYVPARQVVLERNPYYRGTRPHHIARFVVDLTTDSATVLDRIDRNELDYGWTPTAEFAGRAAEFRRKYGINRSRFFAVPASFLRMFVLNTSRPLFKNNIELRQAVNLAVDRRALLTERGPLAGSVTDQYLPPGMPGFRDERIYPLEKPNLAEARRLAKGHLRGGRAVLYTIANPLGVSQAEIVKNNLNKIGLDVVVKQLPSTIFFERLGRPGAPFDIGWSGWLADLPDPSLLNDLFAGRNSPEPNFSRFNSPAYNGRLDRAARLTGPERYREYGRLDVDLARNAAPAIAYAYDNALTLVSARTACVVLNPYLDLAAVCLK